MVEPLKTVLMRRDKLTSEEADELIEQAREDLLAFLDEDNFRAAMNICESHFGLEPDYLDDLMPL